MPEKTLRESLSATLQCIGFGDEQRSTVVQVRTNLQFVCGIGVVTVWVGAS